MAKKIIGFFFLSGLLFFILGVDLNATRLNQEEGIFPNHSVEYVRTQNRNASTSADAAFYNPAGLAFIKQNGLHVMFSSQTIIARKEHTMDYHSIKYEDADYVPTTLKEDTYIDQLPDKYYADIFSPVLPDLDIIYKDKIKGRDIAGFFDISVMQAAPSVEFPAGLAIIDWGQNALFETMAAQSAWPGTAYYTRDAKAVRTEYYIGATLGAAYEIIDWISAAFGFRYIYVQGGQTIKVNNNYVQPVGDLAMDLDYVNFETNSMTLEWDIDTEYKGNGFGIIYGFHFQPIYGLDIGFRYEFYSPLLATKKTNKFIAPPHIEKSGQLDIFKDGSTTDKEYWDDVNSSFDGGYQSPGGEGQSRLKITYPQLIALGVSYKVIDQLRIEANGEITLRRLRDLDGVEKKFKTLGYKAGMCVEWAIIPDLVFSAGYAYTDFGVKPEERSAIDTLLSNHSVGAGFGYAFNESLDINLGAFYVFYVPHKHEIIRNTNVSGPTWHKLDEEYLETRISIGLGITYRLLFGDSGSDDSFVIEKETEAEERTEENM